MSEQQLAAMLEKIAELYDEKDKRAAHLKEIEKEIEQHERIAVELLAVSGLDGVRAAGKSWYLRDFWGLSIPTENKGQVVEAAANAGLEDYITVNTTSLKSWLKEQSGDSKESLIAGTPFEGLLSEYHEMRLSRQTLS